MTETRELICINCPLGCGLTVTIKDGEVEKVQGNTCPKGEAYGKKEVTNPTRIVTSIVKVTGGVLPVVSQAPVSIGDVVLEDVCGTGVPMIATKNVSAV